MKKGDYCFESSNFYGFFNILLITIVVGGIPSIYFENLFLRLVSFVIAGIITFVVSNKIYFNKFCINEQVDYISVTYRFAIFGDKYEKLYYSDLESLDYYDAMTITPAHFRIRYSGKIGLRFNCEPKDFESLSAVFRKYDVKVREKGSYTF